jgi:allophanate hydrolase subunit 2
MDVAAVAPADGDAVLTITAGPRADWFRTDALAGRFYTVSPDSDRVAVRLRGKRIRRSDDRQLAPEGLLRGAVQVPSDGQPLIFLADHPVTGGYPVVAVLTDAAADRAAQLRPGQTVRFAR